MTRILRRRGLGALAAAASVLAGTAALAQSRAAQSAAAQKNIETRCLAEGAQAESKDIQAYAKAVSAACTALLARTDISITQEWNAYARRAMAADILQDFAAAEKDYGEALEHSPAGRPEAELHYRRGLARIALGDNAGAETDAARAIALEPSLKVPGVPHGVNAAYTFCAGYAVNARLVIAACERVVAAKPTNRDILGTAQATRGKALLASGQFLPAVEALGSAISSGASPEIVAAAYQLRSLAHEEADLPIFAEADLQRAEEILSTLPKGKGQAPK